MAQNRQNGRYSGRLTGGKPPLPAGAKNGRLALAHLERCVTQTAAAAPFLYAPAARAFDAMTEAARRDGIVIEAIALYRDFAGQVRMREFWTAKGKPQNAARPGFSNHGWGTAADINRARPGVLKWLVQHAPKFGWDHPRWAGGAAGPEAGPEPWHWQFIVGFQLPEEIRVSVGGQLVPEADALLEEGRVWLALRPVVQVLNARITALADGKAFVDGGALEGWVPMEVRGQRGFVLARDLSALLQRPIRFDAQARELQIA